MYTSKVRRKGVAGFFLSWPFLALKLLFFALTSIYLTQPTGSLVGRVAFEQKGYSLYQFGLHDHDISAVAIGPRGPFSDERGVWVKSDGTFRVDQLPVGEYELRVRSRGFHTEYVNDIVVDEGKANQIGRAVKMSLLSPSVTLSSNVQVYTTKEKPTLTANVSAGKNCTVKIYHTDLQELRKVKLDYGYSINNSLLLEKSGDEDGDPLDDYEPDWTSTKQIDTTWQDEDSLRFSLGKPFAAGDYVAVATAESLDGKEESYSSMIFTVTDLGLIVKKAPNKTLVRALNLLTLQPEQNAEIKVLHSGGDFSKAVKTNKDGFAELEVNKSGTSNFVIVGAKGVNTANDVMGYWTSSVDTYKTYIYTDRPVYRLGQKVNFKGLIRQTTPTGLKNPGANIEITARIDDPTNTEWKTLSLKTNAHGAFYGSVDVPEDKQTGSYQMTVNLPGANTAYSSFQIEEYRKPEFQVEVKSDVPRIVAGTKAQVKVKATYFFGGPVTNARVKYSIFSSADYGMRYSLMPRPKYYSFFDDWGGDDADSSRWYSSYAGGGDFEQTGYVQTDNTGEAVVNFDTKAIVHDPTRPYDPGYADQDYRVDAEVTDLTRMTVSGSGSLLVTPADFELFVTPDSYVNKVGDTFNVGVTAMGYDSKPVANQAVNIKLVRFPYDRAKAVFLPAQVETTVQAVTDKDGAIKTSIKTQDQWPCDTFYIIAESADKTGHMAYGENSIWIANDAQPFVVFKDSEADKIPFEIKMDKKVYKPGETAKIMVSGPIKGNENLDAIVSVEGAELYSYKVVKLHATAQLIEVPITKAYVPNIFLSVAFVGKKHQFYTAEQDIFVSPEANFLNLTVESDKKKYRPGDQVKYTIKATHLDGKPAPNTEVSLGVVDESIYSIMPDSTEDIQKFFYTKRNNSVVTSSSFPEEYSGGPDKTEPHVRKDFKDTAAWLPALSTDKNGIAVATIKVPDNLTTWRATVRGIDMESSVGAGIQKMIVTQDLICRLGVPRFFTQGDVSTVSAVVHNYTSSNQSVKLTFNTSPQFSTDKPVVQTLNVAPEQSARMDWPVTAMTPGKGTVKVKAIGQTASDAVEESFNVRAFGIPAFSARAGLVTKDDDVIHIPAGVSADTAPGTAKYQISVAGSSIGPVLGNFSALIDYPYGCTEQTLSKMIPSIVAYKLHQKLGLPLTEADIKRFDAVNEQSLKKLETYHHTDGGWGWWESDASQPYLTCLVLDGITLLNDSNEYADHHDEWLKGAKKWIDDYMGPLQKQMSDPNLVKENNQWLLNEYRSDMCYMLYAQTLVGSGKPDQKETDWVVAHINELPPEGLSYLTLALKKSGRQADAQKVYDRLISFANVHGDFVDWEHTREMMSKLYKKGIWDEYTYRYTGVETTALALRAVLAMEPTNTTRIEAIKQWLLIQRGKDGWGNTKTTAQVFEVLLDEELLSKAGKQINFTTDVSLSQKLLKEYTFNDTTAYQDEQHIDLPIANNTHGDLTISKKGNGRLYWSTMLTCFRAMKHGDQVAEKATPQGLKLTRKFFRIVPEKMKEDGSMHYVSKQILDGNVKSGETVLMQVLVESPVSIPYVMMEAALPSGGEVVQESSENEAAEESAAFEGDWAPAWWSHQDILDDRIVFFGTTLPAGKSEFHTLVRLETPGTLNINPVSLEGMYTNKVRGYSQPDYLNVTE